MSQATSYAPRSSFLTELNTSLGSALRPEMELTMKVAVLSAGGLNRAAILKHLQQAAPDTEDIEVRMALVRLRRIALMWKGET